MSPQLLPHGSGSSLYQLDDAPSKQTYCLTVKRRALVPASCMSLCFVVSPCQTISATSKLFVLLGPWANTLPWPSTCFWILGNRVHEILLHSAGQLLTFANMAFGSQACGSELFTMVLISRNGLPNLRPRYPATSHQKKPISHSLLRHQEHWSIA